MPRLIRSKVFTSLDAASGFYQISIHEDSRKFMMFITQFGKYSFHHLPFGITNAPEIFPEENGRDSSRI